MGRFLAAAALSLLFCPAGALAGVILDLEAGAQGLYWRPEGRGGLRFNTEGLKAYDFNIAISPSTHTRRGSFLIFQYKAPFVRTAKQNEILAASESRANGLEKYAFGIALEPLVSALKPSLADHPFVRILLSWEFSYSRSLFHGDAIAANDFFFVGRDATTSVSLGQNIVHGAKFLRSGQAVSYRTVFEETEQTMALYTNTEKMHAFRVGRFSVDWRRPSAFNTTVRIVSGGTRYPVVQDTQYRISGIVAKWVSTDMFSKGFNPDMALRFDPHPEIRQPLPLNLPNGWTLGYLGLKVGGCYNWYLPLKDDGVFFSLGGDWSGMSISYSPPKNPSNPNAEQPGGGRIDSEILYSAYARVGYRFLVFGRQSARRPEGKSHDPRRTNRRFIKKSP